MAEPLKNQFGPEIPKKIAAMIASVSKKFNAQAFIKDSLKGYEPLNLKQRAAHIASTLKKHLPSYYPEAIEILIASLGPKYEQTESFGMAPFLYFPHVLFVSTYGLDHFEPSMRAQYELTQRFTAEFSIRAFIERYPEKTLARLKKWSKDSSPHVRRLVSEGTRPRLPWAQRLRDFQKDPSPVIQLLEILRDDPELYVRRSVANNLNDIGKDHPELLAKIAKEWLVGATEDRKWLVHHALRSSVKRGEPGALRALGFGKEAKVRIKGAQIRPSSPRLGSSIEIAFEVTNVEKKSQRVLVDFQIHFVKANGKTAPKVFKLKAVTLAPGETLYMRKKVSLVEMTTRKHYPGVHHVDLLLNGAPLRLGQFNLRVKTA